VTATEVADYLVTSGVPFREAHEITGRIVHEAIERGVTIAELPIPVLRGFHAALDERVLTVLDPEVAWSAAACLAGPRPRTFDAPSSSRARARKKALVAVLAGAQGPDRLVGVGSLPVLPYSVRALHNSRILVQIDFAAKELTIKLVYYGPALSGKTTNLQSLTSSQTQRLAAA